MRAAAAVAVVLVAFGCAPGREKSAPPPAESRFVVANGVRLHYLDWGGGGEPLLLLAGFGNDAYAFHRFAPKLAGDFRVLALTRRGFGQSQKTADCATSARVEDIRAFLDAMHLDRAHLAGHSMAGDELTLFAARHPHRVRKLVYLDAAYDRRPVAPREASDPASPPWAKRLALEALGDARAAEIAPADLPPAGTWRLYVSCRKAMHAFDPDYRKVRAPALAIYAVMPAHPAAARERDAARREALNAWWRANMAPIQRQSIEEFRRDAPRGEVVELPNADHFVFRGATEDEVLRRMRAFLLR